MGAQPQKRTWVSYALAGLYIAVMLAVLYYSPFYQYLVLKQQIDELLLIAEPNDQELNELEMLLRNDNLMIEDHLLIIDRFIELMDEMEMTAVPEALIYVIENDEIDDDVRKRVLAEAAKPIIVTRDAYRTDRRVIVKFVNRSGRLNNHRVETSVKSPRNGSSGSWRNQHFGGGSSTTNWEAGDTYAPPYQPGAYKESVTHVVRLFKGATSTRINPDDEVPLFEIEQEIPFTIKIKPPEEADQLTTVSNDELDQKVYEAYTKDPSSGVMFKQHRTKYHSLDVNSKNLPVSVAFEFIFVDQDGIEHPTSASINLYIDIEKGPSGHGWNTGFKIPSITAPGTYSGKLIFRASEEAAFGNPQIIEYWGGEFDLPFSFTLPEDELFSGNKRR